MKLELKDVVQGVYTTRKVGVIQSPVKIHTTAIIDPTVRIGRDVVVEDNVELKADVVLGRDAKVSMYTTLEEGVVVTHGQTVGDIQKGMVIPKGTKVDSNTYPYKTQDCDRINIAGRSILYWHYAANDNFLHEDHLVDVIEIKRLLHAHPIDGYEAGLETSKYKFIGNASIDKDNYLNILEQVGDKIKIKDVFIHGSVILGVNVIIGTSVAIGKGVIIGQNTEIKEGTIIGDNTTIGNDCIIGKGTVIAKETVIDNEAIVEDFVEIRERCLVESDTIIGESSIVQEDSQVKHGARLGKNVVVYSGETVNTFENVPDEEVISKNVPRSVNIKL